MGETYSSLPSQVKSFPPPLPTISFWPFSAGKGCFPTFLALLRAFLPPTVGPYAPTAGPYAPTVGPYAPTVGPYAPTVGPYAPTVGPYAPTVGPYAPTAGPYAPTVGPYAPTAGSLVPTVPASVPTSAPVAPLVEIALRSPQVGDFRPYRRHSLTAAAEG